MPDMRLHSTLGNLGLSLSTCTLSIRGTRTLWLLNPSGYLQDPKEHPEVSGPC